MKKNILYFHGLGGNSYELQEIVSNIKGLPLKVYTPTLDYSMLIDNHYAFDFITTYISKLNCDIHGIVGISMGGYMAYHLSKYYNVPALLFNPALSDITLSHKWLNTSVSSYCDVTHSRPVTVVLSEEDDVVDIEATKLFLKNEEDESLTTFKVDIGNKKHTMSLRTTLTEMVQLFN